MKNNASNEWIPGIESETQSNSVIKCLLISLIVSTAIFLLLPLSELARDEEWVVREIDSVSLSTPPPPKSIIEKKIEKLAQETSTPKLIDTETSLVKIEALSANLDVGPGDFQAEFSLNQYNPVTNGFEGELVFNLHELDRNPNIIKRGVLRYPPQLKRKGLEGEVKLLIQIDENGKVKVLEVVSYSHPDFIEPSKKAAEGSTYEPPQRNGEKVKVQFYLPVKYNLLNQ
jgi:TonB family protein